VGYAAEISLRYLALFCWSWTAGFLLGTFSRRTIPVNGSLFCFALVLGELFEAPQYLGHWLILPRPLGQGAGSNQSGIYALTFYSVMFPLIIQMLLVVLPSLWGMRQGLRLGVLTTPRRTLLWMCVIATVTALGTENSVWWQVRTWYVRPNPTPVPHLPSLLTIAFLGPVGYWLAAGKTRSEISNLEISNLRRSK
jgi:hypothetical protein